MLYLHKGIVLKSLVFKLDFDLLRKIHINYLSSTSTILSSSLFLICQALFASNTLPPATMNMLSLRINPYRSRDEAVPKQFLSPGVCNINPQWCADKFKSKKSSYIS